VTAPTVNLHVAEPVTERLNVKRETAMFRTDPIAPLLLLIRRPEHHELLIDEVSRWQQAWRYYQQSFARLVPAIAITLRWSNGPYWAEREGRRLTEYERRIARRYRELGPFLDLDFSNFLLHARILCDRAAGLARYILHGHPLPSFTSFNDHREFFEKGRGTSGNLPSYSSQLLAVTGWFEMPLKHVRDKFLVHAGPRHLPTFGHSTPHDLELVLFVPAGTGREMPLAQIRLVSVSARRLARQIDAFLSWFGEFGCNELAHRGLTSR
jgi:hypothetical protein